ncbi:MAG: hypothetical protein C0506_08770 [Anaerolinea sp.]|nr:hypothetical protein [Anaerolinea sp.]
MRQEERRARTRGALLRAAGTAFAEHGYDGASLDAIAAAADLSKGAVYAHFATKRELYLAVVETVLEEAERRLEPVGQALRSAAPLDTAATRYFGSPSDATHVSHLTDLWQMAVRDEAVADALAGFRQRRLAALASAAVDAGFAPSRALDMAHTVGKLIDADTLYGRLRDVWAGRGA